MAWSEIIELWSMKKHSSIFVISISHIRRRMKKNIHRHFYHQHSCPLCHLAFVFISPLFSSLYLNKIYENHGHLQCASDKYCVWWPAMVWYFFNASHVWPCVYISKWYALMCFCKSFIHLINNFDKSVLFHCNRQTLNLHHKYIVFHIL